MALDKKQLARSASRDPEASRKLALDLLGMKKDVPDELAAALAGRPEFVKLARAILKHLDPPDAHKSGPGASRDKQE